MSPIRNTWGNAAPGVAPGNVKRAREQLAARND
jgi:hypothetical protein